MHLAFDLYIESFQDLQQRIPRYVLIILAFVSCKGSSDTELRVNETAFSLSGAGEGKPNAMLGLLVRPERADRALS